MPRQVDTYSIYRYSENNPRQGLIWDEGMDSAWEEFMRHDAIADAYMPQLRVLFPDAIVYICVDLTIVALIQSVPVIWDGDPNSLPDTGWDWAMKTGIEAARAGQQANALCALEIAVSTRYQGRNLSQVALRMMRHIAEERGYQSLIAPVRPSQKHHYPLIPMDAYITWKRDDGLLFDAWLRTHQRFGAQVLKIAPESMRIEGTVADWEAWTGMLFPGSGVYIIPGALAPISIDREANRGTYIEPNVWMLHSLG